ncbi:MAG: MmgE/PrpD family protein [Betaproteobacteria bacterium]|nr:MmgE/PrpD family protein [Betaproteobacteria bacterium]
MKADAAAHRQATVSGRLAQHVVTTRLEDIPVAALESSKRLAIDTLAVAWAGSSAPGVHEACELLSEEGGKPEATVWAFGNKLPARAAAFINSTSAAALDYDGMRATERGSVHADSVVLPAALAVAERECASGSEFLAALALGNDVVTRLGAASGLPHKGWYHTSIYGIFGAAAAAARLLKLDVETTQHAFGIALSQTAATQLPSMSFSLAKRFSSAFAAHAGVFSARLAARGITAPREAFEGKFGFYNLYQQGDAAALFSDLGRIYPHVETAIKKYPSCACNHTAIEAALGLTRENDVAPADVTAVEVTISPYVHRLVGAPFEPGADPQVTAQFSVQYSVACAILRRRLSVADIQDAAVLEPAIVKLACSVKVVVDEARGNSRGATVRIVTTRHGLLEKHVEHIPGSPGSPLTAGDIKNKFAECAIAGVAPLGSVSGELLCSRIEGIASVTDMAQFFDGIIAAR